MIFVHGNITTVCCLSGDDVMSQAHKQAIQENRDILVENLIPDDIFNDLISRKIFTTADVSRIKVIIYFCFFFFSCGWTK